jgi:hypothetical protein
LGDALAAFDPSADEPRHRDPSATTQRIAAEPFPVRRSTYLQLSPTGRSTIPRGAFTSPQSMESLRFAALQGPNSIDRQEGKQLTPKFSAMSLNQIALASPTMARPLKAAHGRNANDSHFGGQHNTVDIERIRRGLDVRTTVSTRCCCRWRSFSLTVYRSCCATFQTRSIK